MRHLGSGSMYLGLGGRQALSSGGPARGLLANRMCLFPLASKIGN